MARYVENRLEELARNILFGMDVVNKRVDSRPKNVKTELNEEEKLSAIAETERFFNDKVTKERLERLKFLITDETNQRKMEKLWGNNLSATSQSEIDRMNVKVGYNPYSDF